MISKSSHLHKDTFANHIEHAPTRDGFGMGCIAAGKADLNVVVLCADLKESTRAQWFEKEFPDRFIEVGVAEQNMVGLAAGMAMAGKVPFIASYAAFCPGRTYEHIRTTVALNEMPVKIGGMHAGVSVGPDGATHQMLEDIGMMRMLPGMTVIAPMDAREGEKAVVAAATHPGPVYLRFGRSPVPTISTKDTPFTIGKALLLWESQKPRIALLATGSMSSSALIAAKALSADGIETLVLHVPTIKPLDEEAVLAAAKTCGKVITIEEHQVMGGFGSAVAEYLSTVYPVPVMRLGIQDQFGQSGTPAELLEHYGISPSKIAHGARTFVGYTP